MTNNNISNSDIKVLGSKIDGLTKHVVRLETKQDDYHEDSQKRLALCEKQTALLEQSQKAICKDVDENVKTPMGKLKDRQEKNDFWTKIIGGLEALILGVLTYLGLSR